MPGFWPFFGFFAYLVMDKISQQQQGLSLLLLRLLLSKAQIGKKFKEILTLSFWYEYEC